MAKHKGKNMKIFMNGSEIDAGNINKITFFDSGGEIIDQVFPAKEAKLEKLDGVYKEKLEKIVKNRK